jgi:serine/threonine protein kinase
MSELFSQPAERRRIKFVEALGKGGFGSVYLADIHSRNNFAQRIAVKVLNEELGSNAEVVGRQRDEARLLAQLNHDHIVKVFDLFEIDGRPAVLMEYVPGVDTGRLLQHGPIPPRAALEIVAATASALHAAHTTVSPFTGRPLAVIHRDVKPSNLLLSEHGTIKVLDFGIARADFDREGQTRSVQFGTARYMSPAQWMNEELSAAVDVFALGITAVELMSGQWGERLPLRLDKYNAGRDGQIAKLRDPRWGSVWWRQLEELLQDMLAFDASERPSAEHVQECCIQLSEEVGGESLRRYAKTKVPPLIEERREKMRDESLLPSADLLAQPDPDPSILTASKTMNMARTPKSSPVQSRRWFMQALMAIGVTLSFWWFVSG